MTLRLFNSDYSILNEIYDALSSDPSVKTRADLEVMLYKKCTLAERAIIGEHLICELTKALKLSEHSFDTIDELEIKNEKLEDELDYYKNKSETLENRNDDLTKKLETYNPDIYKDSIQPKIEDFKITTMVQRGGAEKRKEQKLKSLLEKCKRNQNI